MLLVATFVLPRPVRTHAITASRCPAANWLRTASNFGPVNLAPVGKVFAKVWSTSGEKQRSAPGTTFYNIPSNVSARLKSVRTSFAKAARAHCRKRSCISTTLLWASFTAETFSSRCKPAARAAQRQCAAASNGGGNERRASRPSPSTPCSIPLLPGSKPAARFTLPARSCPFAWPSPSACGRPQPISRAQPR